MNELQCQSPFNTITPSKKINPHILINVFPQFTFTGSRTFVLTRISVELTHTVE